MFNLSSVYYIYSKTYTCTSGVHVYAVNKDTITYHRGNAVLCLSGNHSSVDECRWWSRTETVTCIHFSACVPRLAGETTPSWPRARNHLGKYRVSFPAASDWERDFNLFTRYECEKGGEGGRGDWKEEDGGGYCLYPVLLSIIIAEKSLGLACESQERKRQACHRPTYETSMK